MDDALLPVIEAHDLTKSFGERVAVDKLNISVVQGEIYGLLGPNGAGKSTTIKMLTTLLKPSSGSATVAGYDVMKQPKDVRRSIGYVPQMLSADGALTGYENLKLSAVLYGMPRALRGPRIQEALKFMGLEEYSKRLVRTYSGGMIRKLELAQAMLHRPKVFFLDEPTIGLDPVAKRLVWERLVELKQNANMTILITTHDMEEADNLCDRLAIMHHGKIAVVGKPSDLKSGLGADATLEDVFTHFSGASISEEGEYGDVRQKRLTATILG